MFKLYFGNFFKKNKKINFNIYKNKKKIFFLKNTLNTKLLTENKILKKKIVTILNLVKFIKKKRFNLIHFFQIFSLTKLAFIKNRKSSHSTVFLKYTKNKHSNINTLKKLYLNKNFFKNFIFWKKYKKPKVI